MSWQPPPAFDDFEILRYLGAGGMGTVFLARDTALGRLLAIKFVRNTAADPAAGARFFLEARAIARLHHPNVVSVYRIGAVDGRPYLAYEYVDGRRLDHLPRPMEWQRVVAIGVGLARGLAAAHKCGVLHRDIKPANIMLTEAGEVKLLDFGMAKLADANGEAAATLARPLRSAAAETATLTGGARPADPASLIDAPTLVTHTNPDAIDTEDRLTIAGTVIGTPLYIAPELWQEHPATERSDLYALGMVLYELLVGRLPLAHLSGEALARAALVTDLPGLVDALPEVPRPLTRLIDRCVKRDPAERPRSAAEARDILEALAALYRPFVGHDGDDGREAILLSDSFVRVQASGDQLAPHFYERWFRVDPGVAALFGADLVQQQRMLTAALKLAIDNVRSPERLVPLLEDLGRRHARYGARAEHFSTMGHVLLASLSELDPEWSPAVERAWSGAIARITQLVQHAMEREVDSRTSPRALVGRARLDLPLAQPRTRWARRDGAEVAYQVFGHGALDLLVIGEGVTHLEHTWRHAAPATFLRRLAGFARVIAFDRRGCGLSDRAAAPTLDAALDDVLAVLDAVSSDQPAVLGIGDGALVAAVLAATDPGRVRALVLLGGGARMVPETGAGPDRARIEQAHALVRERWGGPLAVEQFAPSLAADPTYRRWWAANLRNGASPAQAHQLLDLAAGLDVARIAPAIRTPTLMVHRVDDAICPIDQARRLAAAIPAARLVELPGGDHAPWSGDLEAVIAPIHEFLIHVPTARVRPVVVATALAVELRGAASPRASEALAEAARRAFSRHQGVPLDAPDGGLRLAVFDAPGRALACARALALQLQGHAVAIGVETGELGEPGEATGPAVARAAELARSAEVGAIAVGPATRGLVVTP